MKHKVRIHPHQKMAAGVCPAFHTARGRGSQFLLQFLRMASSREVTEPEKKLLATCTCFFLKHRGEVCNTLPISLKAPLCVLIG